MSYHDGGQRQLAKFRFLSKTLTLRNDHAASQSEASLVKVERQSTYITHVPPQVCSREQGHSNALFDSHHCYFQIDVWTQSMSSARQGVVPQSRGINGLGLRRHRKLVKDNQNSAFSMHVPWSAVALSGAKCHSAKPALRRLARRGGIRRINIGIYNEVPRAAREFLTQVSTQNVFTKVRINSWQIIQRAVTLTEYAKRKTVTALDVVYALKTIGTPLYGFGEIGVFDNRARLAASRQRRVQMAMHKEQIDRYRRVEEGLRRMQTGV